MKRSLRSLLLCMVLALLLPMLFGCKGGEPPPPSKEDAASFKGGPMPPEARKKMLEAQEAARNRGMGAATDGANAHK
jgi:hypothetical protein